ncbi:MAG: helix-turn-helix transcriptional regulator [Elusimicrobia bacterium]|nr:helix-turn-helix transcriptional regulator [Elusimicrobiota bacterium]
MPVAAHEYRQAFDLIGQIYDAALDPKRWTGVVERVLSFVHARSGMLFTPFDRIDSAGFYFPVNISQQFLQQYASRYQPYDLWAIAARDAGLTWTGNVIDGDDVVPRQRLLSSPFYKEFLRVQGTSRICFAMIFGRDEQPGILTTALTVHRGVRSKPFSSRSKERMRLLVPHFSRALGVMFRLRDAELKLAATRAALDRLATGVVLVGERRQVVFANHAARSMLGERDGLMLVPGRGGDEHVAAAAHGKTTEIDSALALAVSPEALDVPHFSTGIRVSRADRGPIALNVSALPDGNTFGAGADVARAIIFLTDTAQPVAIDTPVLRRLYFLTDAESRVVEALCSGGTLAEIAARLGVSETTVRTQLQSVFRKTGTARQPDLVKLVLSLSSTRR